MIKFDDYTISHNTTLDQAFWAHVSIPETESDPTQHPCWTWTGSKTGGKSGKYGQCHGVFTDPRKGWEYAHRLSYLMHHGPLGEGEYVRHLCANPACVNPFHLRKGSNSLNQQDRLKCFERCPVSPKIACDLIRMKVGKTVTYANMSQHLKINQTSLYQIAKGKTYTHRS